jgi:acetyl esterase/lipase
MLEHGFVKGGMPMSGGSLPAKAGKTAFCFLMFALNLMNMALLLFYIAKPTPNLLNGAYGWAIFAALALNPILAITGYKTRLNTAYFILHEIGVALIPLLSTMASSDPQNKSSISYPALLILFALFTLPFLETSYNLGFMERKAISHARKLGAFPAIAAFAVQCLIMAGCIYAAIDMLTRSSNGILEVFVPEYSLYIGLEALGAGVLLFGLSKRRWLRWVGFAAGVVLFAFFTLPLALTLNRISDYENSYRLAFEIGRQEVKNEKPFSLQDYFLNRLSGKYSVVEDIIYHEGAEGIDNGIELRFDGYWPEDAQGVKLPTLIRIHGGAWSIGDKGASNYAQMNKHFASLGYAVFDIQYGLNNGSKFVEFAPAQEKVEGPFTIDDMMRHIGIFTKHLADRSVELNADISQVFVSGGSAGGQLASALALGLASGKYSKILDPRVNVIGLIPFYPANGLSQIGGTPELIDPIALVDQDSPPCLIYQGTHDGIVNPAIALNFYDAYLASGNIECCLLSMPLASHGSDIFFTGFYNQVFVHYMERFMNQLIV